MPRRVYGGGKWLHDVVEGEWRGGGWDEEKELRVEVYVEDCGQLGILKL